MSVETDNDDDPVAARIARLIDSKRLQNADVLSALKVAEESWERLNKEIETAVGTEFELVTAEQEAVVGAVGRLVEPDLTPSEEGFVVAGRVAEPDSGTGLPQMLVRVVTFSRDGGPDRPVEVVTDGGGLYRTIVEADGASNGLRVAAHTNPDGRPAAVVSRDAQIVVGGSIAIDVPVSRRAGIADRLTAGEAARDSVDETLAAVEQRLASMRAAHTATTRFADLTRDGLRELSSALASDPPPVPAAVGVEAIAPAPDRVEPVETVGQVTAVEPVQPVEPVKPVEPVTPIVSSTSLVKIPGIGPRRAQQLRDAGIEDVEAFVSRPIEELSKLLGVQAEEFLNEAKLLLERERAPT